MSSEDGPWDKAGSSVHCVTLYHGMATGCHSDNWRTFAPSSHRQRSARLCSSAFRRQGKNALIARAAACLWLVTWWSFLGAISVLHSFLEVV